MNKNECPYIDGKCGTHALCKKCNKAVEIVDKNFYVRGRNFVIVRNCDGFYCAIEDKYITDGKINTSLSGQQLHASRSVAECLEDTRHAVEMDYYMEHGLTKAEAFCKIFDCFDKLEIIKALFEK